MRRSEALRLYRAALRTARRVPPARAAIAAEARAHFEGSARVARVDPSQEKYLLAKGAEFVEALREMTLLAR